MKNPYTSSEELPSKLGKRDRIAGTVATAKTTYEIWKLMKFRETLLIIVQHLFPRVEGTSAGLPGAAALF